MSTDGKKKVAQLIVLRCVYNLRININTIKKFLNDQ
jgi:hypothetical protein